MQFLPPLPPSQRGRAATYNRLYKRLRRAQPGDYETPRGRARVFQDPAGNKHLVEVHRFEEVRTHPRYAHLLCRETIINATEMVGYAADGSLEVRSESFRLTHPCQLEPLEEKLLSRGIEAASFTTFYRRAGNHLLECELVQPDTRRRPIALRRNPLDRSSGMPKVRIKMA